MLGLLLLFLSQRLVALLFVPAATLWKPDAKKKSGVHPIARTFLTIVLVKYLLVAGLLWTLARMWNEMQLLAFCGGFSLVHLDLLLRAVGRALFTRQPVSAHGNQKGI